MKDRLEDAEVAALEKRYKEVNGTVVEEHNAYSSIAYDAIALLRSRRPAPVQQDDLTEAAFDVLSERSRQVKQEGWSENHDDQHTPMELAKAGAAYVLNDRSMWPWDSTFWKPKGLRRNYVRAAALILAAIERIDRSEQDWPASAPAPDALAERIRALPVPLMDGDDMMIYEKALTAAAALVEGEKK